ncbi:MAG: aminotransferase class I/II-fold pyridoxal phosphate-dependent enzyme [Flavobacteriales bacterium]
MFEEKLKNKLSERQSKNALRQLKTSSDLVDFCSNDYLGYAKLHHPNEHPMGATGSRLISGTSNLHLQTEQEIANYHNTEAALIFNSGYDANLGFFSCVPQKEDTVIYDQLCHASIRDGIRLGLARSFAFKHNDLNHLKEKMNQASGQIFVVVESVYSMNGDFSPLEELFSLCQTYHAKLIVDEAHAFGVFGSKGQGLCQDAYARIYTFGKALGSHGAAIVGSQILIDYLVNFSRPFIYTTALAPHSVKRISWAYQHITTAKERIQLQNNIAYFKSNCQNKRLIESSSAIQCVLIGGNDNTKKIAELLATQHLDVRAILHPTVEEGKERLRICLHAFNTKDEIHKLCQIINNIE